MRVTCRSWLPILALGLGLGGCAGANPYLAGLARALQDLPPPPGVTVRIEVLGAPPEPWGVQRVGSCEVLPSGKRRVTVWVQAIARTHAPESDPEHAAYRTLTHELLHARLTCSGADHDGIQALGY